MNKEKLKSEIYEMIREIEDESNLREILAFIQNPDNANLIDEVNEPQALYGDKKKESNFSDLHRELKSRSMAVSSGEFITQEDLENESENW